ncbi:hypothetical protein GCM10009716_38090 [Streptomyces sodiiphilus]|uniref:VOC domain-containing protein n=1 Tax=Streptomyces sodiiphilus TaxID=226217 RepID=A0ABN2PRI9_9ACTN
MNGFSSLARTVLLADDQDAALAFYRDVLGFRVLHDETTGGYRYLHIGLPGDSAGLWLMEPGGERERALVGRQSGGQPLLVLYTSDAAAVGARLRERGVRVWAEQEGSAGRSLHFADLYGNVLVAAELPGAGEDE